MAFKPELPKPIRKHFIIEDESNLIVMGKLSSKIIEFSKTSMVIENLNTYHSTVANKHVAIITYYE